MGSFSAMNHCGHPHLDALAHEIGHYLGLPHTFAGDPFPARNSSGNRAMLSTAAPRKL